MEQLINKAYSSDIQDLDEKGIVVVAANAFGNEDMHGDISMPGSYTKTISERFNRLKWYKNHNQNELLGVPLEAKQDDKYLIVKGKLNLNKQIAKDVYEDYRMYADAGKSLEHSVGVIAVKRDKDDKRKVYEWKWFEYSTLTNWGANPNTPMLSIKSEASIIEAVDFLEGCLRKANYSDVKGKAVEQQIMQLKALLNDEPSTDTTGMKPQEYISIISNLKLA